MWREGGKIAVRLVAGKEFMRQLTLYTSRGHYGEFMDGSEVAFTSREIARFVEEMPTIICPSCGAPHDGRGRADGDGEIGGAER
mgnify:CR=1 FL=1